MENLTEGSFSIGPASLYTSIKKLLSAALIELVDTENKNRKTYITTKKGWFLYKFGFLGYKLEKGKPQDIQYSLDYTNEADEEYYSYFEAAGWLHVCSIGNKIHIFSAPEGTKPIYTDKTTNIEKYENQYSQMEKVALPSLILFILSFSLSMLAKYSYIPRTLGNISIILMFISLVATIFSGLPCISYYFKVKRLKK